MRWRRVKTSREWWMEGINKQQQLSIVEEGKVNEKYAAEAEHEIERYFSSLGSQKGRTLERACTEADCSKYALLLSLLSSPLLSLLTLYKREGSHGYTRGSEQGHEEDTLDLNLLYLPWPQASLGRVKLDLSSSFFDLIQALGKGISPQFTFSK